MPGMRHRLLPELLARDRVPHLLPLVRPVAPAGADRLEEAWSLENMGRKFRQLLKAEPYLFTGGIYSPLDAQIAEKAGMKY